MIDVPYAPDHNTNVNRVSDAYEPCLICGRAVDVKKRHWRALVHNGGSSLVTEAEYDALELTNAAAGCGSHPIGPDCAKNNPQVRPYLVRCEGV